MNVDIYVENNEGKYEALDLFKDESIMLKFKLKDSNDFTKSFSTYSQSFVIPASPNNDRLLNYYFNSSVLRNNKKYLKAKIYVKNNLYKVGLILITSGTHKNNKLDSYSINFFTSITTIVDKLGVETLKETLTKTNVIPCLTIWDNNTIKKYITNPLDGSVIGTNIQSDVIVPLASNKRIWTSGGVGVNNINFTSTSPSGVKNIEYEELTPSIPLTRIISGIEESTGISINSELFEKDEFKKMYVLCSDFNKDYFDDSTVEFNPTITVSGTVPPTITPSSFVSIGPNSSLNINLPKRSDTLANTDFRGIRTLVRFSINPTNSNIPYILIIKNGVTGEVLQKSEERFGISSIQVNFEQFMDKVTDVNLKFSIASASEITFTPSINTTTTFVTFEGGVFVLTPMHCNISTYSLTKVVLVNLFKTLPGLKTVDFLNSIIKMFNLVFVDTGESDNILLKLKSEFYQDSIDYTDVIDIEKIPVKTQTLFSEIRFKHKTSKYNSNVAFTSAVGKDYGEEVYKNPDSNLKEVLKVETNFSIVPERIIQNTNVSTYYPFGEKGETNNTYGTLFTPITDEFTVFYVNGLRTITGVNFTGVEFPVEFGIRNGNVIEKLTQYNKVSIAYSDVNDETYINSLGFSIEVDNNDINFQYTKNLYSNYYKNQINSLHNPNTRVFEYECYLTQKQLIDFNLENEVIIENRRFSIEEAEIDITSGKSKIVLQSRPTTQYTNIIQPPINFTAILTP